jgi:hypothetical protein
MIRRGDLFDPPNLAEILDPYAWNDVGADVVGCHDSLTKMVHQWMGEEFHRSIILHAKLRRAGIGIRRVDGKSACGRDQYWATVIVHGGVRLLLAQSPQGSRSRGASRNFSSSSSSSSPSG